MFRPEAPLSPDIDRKRIAAKFRPWGAHSRSRATSRAVAMSDLLAAGVREYREMGRIVSG